MHPRGNADTAGLGKGFETCCDVDPVAEDVAVLDNNVSDVNTDTELDALVRRRRRTALGHLSLHRGRAVQSIHHTAELDQQPVTRRLDEPAVVRGDGRIKQLGPDGFEPRESVALVCPDQS